MNTSNATENLANRINLFAEKMTGSVVNTKTGVINGNHISVHLYKYACLINLLEDMQLDDLVCEMRAGHDKGDGHFSTKQVECAEALQLIFNDIKKL